jgi:asparagine synthase (glutamine-hydrolysing)
MCGIAGNYRYARTGSDRADETVGLRMLESLVHRGPDDGGLLVTDRFTLGHRRLSILDLSPLGHQPMSDESGQCWIAFNGEIYNFRELRRELEQSGRRFRSTSDTEVLLQSYLEWGLECVHRLNGMFAFAVWDGPRERLWLVRDPVGVKPLFYHDDGRRLRFGSEIKAILADESVSRQPDWEGIDAFLTFGYLPAPLTGFEGVRQLPPGSWLLVEDGHVSRHAWYRLPYPDGPPTMTADEAVELLRGTLHNCVERQMVSDVPLGVLVSGGLDSAAVAWHAQEARGDEVDGFHIAFGEGSFDESPYARRVAEACGIRLHARTLTTDNTDLLARAVWHAEEPLADNSMIPFYLLAGFARERVTVALSGDGADELLAGYMTYQASRYAPLYRRLPGWLRRGAIAPLVRALPVSTRKYGLATLARRFVEGAEEGTLRDHCSWRQIVSSRNKQTLYASVANSGWDAVGRYAAAAEDAPDWLTPLERQLHVDFRCHLPSDMLTKVDRMSMAHALEVRVPLLDLEMVAACLRIPAKLKLHGRSTKHVLKKVMAGVLPAELVQRRKQGFVMPVERWMRNEWLPLLNQHLAPAVIGRIPLLRPERVTNMVQRHAAGQEDFGYDLFALLVLSLWWQVWMERTLTVGGGRASASPTTIHRIGSSSDTPVVA